MDYLAHIREDLEMLLYKHFEANESNSYRDLCTKEIKDVSKIIKNIAEAEYYDTIVKAMHEGTVTYSVDPQTKAAVHPTK